MTLTELLRFEGQGPLEFKEAYDQGRILPFQDIMVVGKGDAKKVSAYRYKVMPQGNLRFAYLEDYLPHEAIQEGDLFRTVS